jgi:hypothetical protein
MLRQLLLDVVGGYPPDQLEISLVSTTVGAFDAHGVLKIFGLTLCNHKPLYKRSRALSSKFG